MLCRILPALLACWLAPLCGYSCGCEAPALVTTGLSSAWLQTEEGGGGPECPGPKWGRMTEVSKRVAPLAFQRARQDSRDVVKFLRKTTEPWWTRGFAPPVEFTVRGFGEYGEEPEWALASASRPRAELHSARGRQSDP